MTDSSNHTIRSQIPLLAIIMLGMFISVLNQTLLNVAIPHLITEFNVTATDAEWLLTGYMLVNGILIPLSAFLIERFGIRNLFITAMIFFTGGSFVCGLAPTFSILLIGRLLQAVGAGILMPLSMTLILSIFPPESRGKGMGIFGLGIMFAPAIGPTLSGWVMEHYSWRLLFNGIAPLGLLVLILSIFLLKDLGGTNKNLKLDLIGTILSTIGFGALLYGLSEAGSKGWDDLIVDASLVVGVICIFLFVIQQLNSKRPMLDFRILKYPVFTLSSIINMITTIGMFGGMFLVPIYLQNLRGFTPLESGLLMLPGAILMGILSPVSGVLFDKIGPRPLAVVGMLITLVTTYEFTNLTLATSYTFIVVLYMVRMVGMGLLMMPIQTAGMNELPREKNAHGTALANTTRQIAGSIGISFITTIFTNRTTFHMGLLRNSANTMDPQFQQSFMDQAIQMSQQLGIPIEQAKAAISNVLYGQIGLQSSMSGIQDAFYWTTGITVLAFILSFFLTDVRKRKKPVVPTTAPKLEKPKESLEPVTT
ncbi:DHA2 family efflux MFS transporter permease subunit [Shimazuella sp. AN120528]|uniref:DHA2 family efflux MFS transporter permease subunit n=1 Tax=Shimazuella soli TaxID=1892854 RepID=UPI001F0D21D2|nr:DHA2 family efflux MFS transporter permease subunit [Shimazuella soli]MCH5585364.1 DHA2 family efflux MFS transporter permease subunit [Shimazuella soli]